MMTSKQRAELRAKANELETTLMVGKEGITEALLSQAEAQLDARELIKGKVLETAFMTAREASDAICEAIGADGIQAVGSKFVIYRKSEKLAAEAKKKAQAVAKVKYNPVRAGAQKRRKAAKAARDERNDYFKQAAIQQAIERRKALKDD